jgi:hypothetical protein
LTFPLLWKKTSVKYFLYSMSLNWK